MEPVDLHNSMQNAFVQDWLQAFIDKFHMETEDEIRDEKISDYNCFHGTIEVIQGLYDYQDHEERKNAVATGGDIDAGMRVLLKLKDLVAEEHELYHAFNMTYAFLHAVKEIGMK